jgi:4-amino-4-deoxy-L-arabinose transferase-like glycosyltransferase
VKTSLSFSKIQKIEPEFFWSLLVLIFSSTRLFEQGISLDPALYSSIARSFSEDHLFWSLKASNHLFPQYYEHPFLMEWLQGGVFYFFGATDFTSRLLSWVIGSFSFYYIFKIGEQLKDKSFAHILCFLTLLSLHYVGSIPTFYLEISMTFFMLGSLSYFLAERGVMAGLFLGCAFLTKGLAALPMLGCLGLIAIYQQQFKILKHKTSYLAVIFTALVIAVFCLLQDHYGQYSFIKNYYYDTFVDRTLKPGLNIGPWQFIKKFFEYHPAHLLLFLGSFFVVYKKKTLRPVFVVGLLCSLSFIIANAILGFPFRHYYYPIYPIVNILSTVCLYDVLKNKTPLLQKISVGIVIVFILFFQIYPNAMRRKAPSDFYQLKSVMTQLKKENIHEIETMGISINDWVYRQFSLWYWNMDSKILEENASVSAEVILVDKNQPFKNPNYSLCEHSKKYLVYVKSKKLNEICQNYEIELGLLK